MAGGNGSEHVVAIALNGGSKSKYVVKWALDKFMSEANVTFKIFHVYLITAVPTPMGYTIPLAQVRDDIADAYKKEMKVQKTEMLLPYQNMCVSRKVPTEIVLIESDKVPHALAMEISRNGIKDLVIGASSNSNGFFSRKVMGQTLSSIIAESAPRICNVYVIFKGKLESLRPLEAQMIDDHISDFSESSSKYSLRTLGVMLKDNMNEAEVANYFDLDIALASTEVGASHSGSSKFSLPYLELRPSPSSSTSLTMQGLDNHPLLMRKTKDLIRWKSLDLRDEEGVNGSPSLTMQGMDKSPRVKSSLSETIRKKKDLIRWKSLDLRGEEDVVSFILSNTTTNIGTSKSFRKEAKSWMTEQTSLINSPLPPSSPQTKTNTNTELESIIMKPRHVRGMYTMAQSKTIDARRKPEEAIKSEEIRNKEDKAQEQSWIEKDKVEDDKKEVDYVRECTVKESYHGMEDDLFVAREAKEILASPNHQYQKFSWEDIVSGSSSFADENKLGMGSYGTVYKCKLHHTNVAVKVLHSSEGSQSKQFQQELEILSRIRHPHLLLLLGACPEKGCLVYELMENGSLEERLFRSNNTPPIEWYDRFRIAWEVASALVFLHNAKPKPIIHRDMKPANILLDSNLVSKIGDAGLCTMLNPDPSSITMVSETLYKHTSPVGTLFYIDPEYHRTGLLSTKSDVYALGIIILQLLTAKPAIGIAHMMEDVINQGGLMQILDNSAGKWPVKEATELALLGLQCAELRGKDRPNLKKKVLPILKRLKETVDDLMDVVLDDSIAPPSHFICPLLKDVMNDPCVASDGYTYDRKAIKIWVEENDISPMTNLPLATKNLIPNFALQYAISEWKEKRKSMSNTLGKIN